MSVCQYPRYTATGVVWMPTIPDHWGVERLKACARLRTDKAIERTNAVGLENVESWTGRFLPSETEFSGDGIGFSTDDLLFGKLRPYLAKVLIAPFDGEAVGDFLVLSPAEKMVARFLQYRMLTREFIEIVDGSTFGSKMPRADWDFVGGMPVAVPPLCEQHAIVAFLDRETAKIDALVKEQERLTALLREKRQAIISHAVTKGLNPNAERKESGVEWLGEVPSHWQVLAMRALGRIVRGASPRPAGDPRFFNGESVPWVTVAEITKDADMFLRATETCLTEEGAQHSVIFRAGTLIYSNSGVTLGVPKILRIDACANDGVIAFLDLRPDVYSEFLYFYLSSITQAIRDKVRQGSGQPNLNTDIVKAIRLAVPPLAEQQAIVAALKQSITAIDALYDQAQESVRVLLERRSATISAAVTGQIDVRHFAPTEAA